MKRFFTFCIWAFAVAFVSCKEEGAEQQADWFGEPQVSAVSGTAAEVVCLSAFADGVLTPENSGFSYAALDENGQPGTFADVRPSLIDGGMMRVRLTGLRPSTSYAVQAFVSLGSSRMTSRTATFVTTDVAPDETVLEITSLTTLTVDAGGDVCTIAYHVVNPQPGTSVEASCPAGWIGSFDYSVGDEISFLVDKNTGEERSAVVTVACPGAEARTVTVVQRAAGSGEIVKPEFGTPSSSSVTKNSAAVSCSFRYTGSGSVTEAYFSYTADGGTAQRVDVTTAQGSKTAELSGLKAATRYTFRLCIVIDGAPFVSGDASFTTSDDQGGTVTGDTKYPGWPELIPEDAAKAGSEYYYAYHLCPDFTVNGYKARNYTVCFSATHHCPVWVAAPRHACYEGSSGRSKTYGADPDIPSNLQYNSKSTGDGCNKGHMLGSAERTRSAAINRQVFYYSNIAPQYSSGFNTGGGGWNTLEAWIDEKVCADTTYLVIGTYFEAYTDGYGKSAQPKKISFGGRSDVSCPTMFYIAALRTKKGTTGKSVRNCTADELMCAAFVRAHSNDLKGQKVTSREMMSIADLEKLTGHRFFVNVPNAPKSSCTPSDWGL